MSEGCGGLPCGLIIQSRDPQADGLSGLVERRLRFVLRRLKARVPRVQVALSDVNRPRGGIDKRCQVALRTDGAGELVVSSVAADWRSALDAALARAARFLLRQARRGQDFRRLQRARPRAEG